MSRMLWRVAAAVLAATVSAKAETAVGIDAAVVAPGGMVDGLRLDAYTNLWWQWAFSMPQSESPVIDTEGALCGVGQSGPVWFLAGGYGSSRIHRNCSVPANRHLFFPVVNMLQELFPATEADCPAVKASAAANNDGFVYLKVILDGVTLAKPERFRLASPECFDPYARTPADAGAPEATVAATDGYWIMLRPLPGGRHHLEFRAFYGNPDEAFGDMVQNIVYDLTILDQ